MGPVMDAFELGTGAKKLQVSRERRELERRGVAACIPSMQSKEAARQPRLTPEWRENGCKVLVLAVLVLQNSSLVLATTYARHREGELFLTTVLVFLGECIKTSVSILCTVVTSGTSTGQVLHTSFVTEAHSLWRMAVPAVLYTFSNNLAMVAMSNLSAVAYQVANQLKIPATALMARLLLQRLHILGCHTVHCRVHHRLVPSLLPPTCSSASSRCRSLPLPCCSPTSKRSAPARRCAASTMSPAWCVHTLCAYMVLPLRLWCVDTDAYTPLRACRVMLQHARSPTPYRHPTSTPEARHLSPKSRSLKPESPHSDPPPNPLTHPPYV